MNEFYLCAMSACSKGGIYQYRETDGEPELLSFAPLCETNWLTRSPDGKFLYATCRNNGDGACAAFKIQPDGSLQKLNQMESRGKSPCYVVVSPDGKYLYCANYMSGNVAEFSLNADGSIGGIRKMIRHTGKGVNPKRQEGPHTHFTNLTPDKRFLIVIDLGIDAVKLYPLTADGLDEANVRTFRLPDGSGPRHLVFHSSGKYAWLVNELGNSVMTLSYDMSGTFQLLNTVSTLPEHVLGPSKAAAIRLSPDERFLYASNRGYDSIACCRINQETMFPERIDIAASCGISPRDINFLPSGKKFAAANEFSDVTALYDYNPETGLLMPDGNMIRTPHPLAIFW